MTHRRFHEWSKEHLWPDRLHWVVSDATQAGTLIHGGYSDFWWSAYEYANVNCPRLPENRNVRFESHRATAVAYTGHSELERAAKALRLGEEVLSEDPAWANRHFASAVLKTRYIDFYHAKGDTKLLRRTIEALEDELAAWLSGVEPDAPSAQGAHPLGSWAQLNADRPPGAAFIAVHNAACALARSSRFPEAERLFEIIIKNKCTFTGYGQTLYLLSCWRNRGDREEVRRKCREFGLEREYLQRHALELLDVIGDIDRPRRKDVKQER